MAEQKNIHASFIIEIMGRPAEHVDKTMEQLVDRLGKEDGITVKDKKIHPPVEYDPEEGKKSEEAKEKSDDKKEVKVTQQLYTSFVELECEFEGLEPLLFAAFNYMPSNIEISSPETFILKNSDIGGLLTGIIVRLHRYDEVTKKLVVDKQILEKQLKQIMEKFNIGEKKSENDSKSPENSEKSQN